MKKTKLYEVRSNEATPGLCKRDPTDLLGYVWYDISSARVERNGVLRMPAAGQCQNPDGTYMHWTGVAVLRSDHLHYAEVAEAVRQRGPEAQTHPYMNSPRTRSGRRK